MSTPEAKRRRLNDAAKTLHKPFKSPFRTPLKPPTAADTLAPAPTPTPSLNPSEARPSQRILPTLQKKTSPRLIREAVSLRSDIQMLTQAYRLATSSEDADLNLLIDTWRAASRAAAEELFAGTRDRVNRMGGVGAWREREREQREWRKQWDREGMDAETAAGQGQDGDHAEYEEEVERDGGGVGEGDLGGADDDSFTMDMMLRTLNIDLKLIGYDKEAQRWDE
ncbi:uncharacterized protein BDR25DRAFT_334137 [Lindgomyces ingoldianus]|uniref:Uncharacterized protein n=1 Tax=Lindgomyces ingoldianus TaxID=673940 RepID=A0ACB6QXQ2_9PLEO|nr:uncharacterized protein BDR25DRAFT_334137 [Lindgomyces ingoldianus]KAF2470976.1 hypothetical protein BDR25DRAFT_334137 [Lindgomyces ingoldianus]